MREGNILGEIGYMDVVHDMVVRSITVVGSTVDDFICGRPPIPEKTWS